MAEEEEPSLLMTSSMTSSSLCNLTVNPFETANSLDSMHLPTFSPSVFKASETTPCSTRKKKDFRWSIDQMSLLFPADIDELPQQQEVSLLSKEKEQEVQEAINQFFSQKEVAPSPWSGSRAMKHVTFSPKPPSVSILSEHSENSACSSANNSLLGGVTGKVDVSCQTKLTLPISFDLEALLGKGRFMYTKTSVESFPVAPLRRKLFTQSESSTSEKEASRERTNSKGCEINTTPSTPKTPGLRDRGHFFTPRSVERGRFATPDSIRESGAFSPSISPSISPIKSSQEFGVCSSPLRPQRTPKTPNSIESQFSSSPILKASPGSALHVPYQASPLSGSMESPLMSPIKELPHSTGSPPASPILSQPSPGQDDEGPPEPRDHFIDTSLPFQDSQEDDNVDDDARNRFSPQNKFTSSINPCNAAEEHSMDISVAFRADVDYVIEGQEEEREERDGGKERNFTLGLAGDYSPIRGTEENDKREEDDREKRRNFTLGLTREYSPIRRTAEGEEEEEEEDGEQRKNFTLGLTRDFSPIQKAGDQISLVHARGCSSRLHGTAEESSMETSIFSSQADDLGLRSPHDVKDHPHFSIGASSAISPIPPMKYDRSSHQGHTPSNHKDEQGLSKDLPEDIHNNVPTKLEEHDSRYHPGFIPNTDTHGLDDALAPSPKCRQTPEAQSYQHREHLAFSTEHNRNLPEAGETESHHPKQHQNVDHLVIGRDQHGRGRHGHIPVRNSNQQHSIDSAHNRNKEKETQVTLRKNRHQLGEGTFENLPKLQVSESGPANYTESKTDNQIYLQHSPVFAKKTVSFHIGTDFSPIRSTGTTENPHNSFMAPITSSRVHDASTSFSCPSVAVPITSSRVHDSTCDSEMDTSLPCRDSRAQTPAGTGSSGIVVTEKILPYGDHEHENEHSHRPLEAEDVLQYGYRELENVPLRSHDFQEADMIMTSGHREIQDDILGQGQQRKVVSSDEGAVGVHGMAEMLGQDGQLELERNVEMSSGDYSDYKEQGLSQMSAGVNLPDYSGTTEEESVERVIGKAPQFGSNHKLCVHENDEGGEDNQVLLKRNLAECDKLLMNKTPNSSFTRQDMAASSHKSLPTSSRSSPLELGSLSSRCWSAEPSSSLGHRRGETWPPKGMGTLSMKNPLTSTMRYGTPSQSVPFQFVPVSGGSDVNTMMDISSFSLIADEDEKHAHHDFSSREMVDNPPHSNKFSDPFMTSFSAEALFNPEISTSFQACASGTNRLSTSRSYDSLRKFEEKENAPASDDWLMSSFSESDLQEGRMSCDFNPLQESGHFNFRGNIQHRKVLCELQERASSKSDHSANEGMHGLNKETRSNTRVHEFTRSVRSASEAGHSFNTEERNCNTHIRELPDGGNHNFHYVDRMNNKNELTNGKGQRNINSSSLSKRIPYMCQGNNSSSGRPDSGYNTHSATVSMDVVEMDGSL